MSTLTQITEQIAFLEKEIQGLEAKIPALDAAYKDWLRASQEPCKQISSSKRKACEDDKAWKASKAEGYRLQLEATKKSIARKIEEKNALIKSQAAYDTASVNLSEHGDSLEAKAIEAQGAADAQRIASAAAGEAENTVAENEAQTGKIIAIIIVSAILLFLLIFGIYKFKTRNK